MNKIKNKNILLFGISGILLFFAAFGPVYVFAEDNQELLQNPRLERLNNLFEERAAQIKQRIEEARQQAETRLQQRREAMQERMNQLGEKRNLTEKITKQFERINKVWTDHFVLVLDKLDAILQKIKSRTEKAETNGQNVSEVNAAISKAENAIQTAREAVIAQAAKTYELNIESENQEGSNETRQNNLVSTIREQIKELRNNLFSDLTSLRDGAIKDARNAVKESFQALSKVPKVDEEPAENENNNQ